MRKKKSGNANHPRIAVNVLLHGSISLAANAAQAQAKSRHATALPPSLTLQLRVPPRSCAKRIQSMKVNQRKPCGVTLRTFRATFGVTPGHSKPASRSFRGLRKPHFMCLASQSGSHLTASALQLPSQILCLGGDEPSPPTPAKHHPSWHTSPRRWNGRCRQESRQSNSRRGHARTL